MDKKTFSFAVGTIAFIVFLFLRATDPGVLESDIASSNPEVGATDSSSQQAGTLASGRSSPPIRSAGFTRLHGKQIKRVYQAKVIRVVDGDTVELLLPDNTHPNCRMDSIDAPEKAQAYGSKSREALKQLTIGKIADVYETDIDRYGRPVVFLVVDGIDVAAWMVGNGFAWEYLQYSKSESLGAYEAQARNERLGLWQLPDATPPWEWRKR